MPDLLLTIDNSNQYVLQMLSNSYLLKDNIFFNISAYLTRRKFNSNLLKFRLLLCHSFIFYL
jgi:hypothetical protein